MEYERRWESGLQRKGLSTSLSMGLADKNGDTSADDDDVQWLVTLALDGIWSSVTEVGPWCPKVLYGMVSMVSQLPATRPLSAAPLSLNTQWKSPTDASGHLLVGGI